MSALVRPLPGRDTGAGRMCPADYRYPPSVFDRPAELAAEVLYVVGGLYGNLAALDAVEQLADAERAPTTIVFNGDFHWFDAEPGWFAEVENRVARHQLIRGNVETEIARGDDIGAGCGCAYPEGVDDGVVQRSNRILGELRAVEASLPLRPMFERLPMHRVATVGGMRVGIVHGDANSLAGWRFDVAALDDPAAPARLDAVARAARIDAVARAARIDAFASTHTCAAVLRHFDLPGGRVTIINNGAAGMPNFAGARFGLLTRIATRPSPHRKLYGMTRDGVFIDAVAIPYDTRTFLDRFLARWPEGSPAHESYFPRIVDGPRHSVELARPT